MAFWSRYCGAVTGNCLTLSNPMVRGSGLLQHARNARALLVRMEESTEEEEEKEKERRKMRKREKRIRPQ